MGYRSRLMVMGALGLVHWGCVPSHPGEFANGSFVHSKHGYRVVPRPTGGLVPGDWRLDNFHGDPGDRKPKHGADYEGHYFVDIDRDGKTDDIGEYYLFDLRFTNARDDGVIWLRTVPLPLDDANKALRVLANAYVEGIAHDRYEVVQLEGKLHATDSEVSYATQVIASASGTVGNREAFAVTVNVANTNQLKLDPNARWRRVELVLVRTPFAFDVKGTKKPEGPVPVLMVHH
jgi:hypothetical protein